MKSIPNNQPLADQHDTEHITLTEAIREGGGTKNNASPSVVYTPIASSKSLQSTPYEQLKETHISPKTPAMAHLQKEIDSHQPATSSRFSTPMMDYRQVQKPEEIKYPIKESETAQGEKEKGEKQSSNIKKANESTKPSNEPILKAESMYTGTARTAYGHGYSEGYKRAIADLQGHAGKGMIEQPNPSVYKILTQQNATQQENIKSLSMASISDGVGSAGKKTKSFFVRVLEKLGCSTDVDQERRQSTMERVDQSLNKSAKQESEARKAL